MLRAARWLLFLVAASAILWVCLSSSFLKTCVANQTAASQEQSEKNSPKLILAIADKTQIYCRCFGHTIFEFRDAVTAVATVFIAFFTYILFAATRGLVVVAEIQSEDMKRSIAATEIAAEAAKKSADVAEKSLLAANNPIVTITELELRDANEFIDKPHIHWGLRNSGPGMGVVHTMHTRTGIGIVTPEGTKVFRSKEKIGWGSAIESKDTAPGFSITTPMLQSQIAEIRSGATILTFLIQTDGQNIFKDRFSVVFSFRFDHTRGAFSRVGGEGAPETNDAS